MYTLEKSYIKKDWEWQVEDIGEWTIEKVLKETQSVRMIVTFTGELVSFSARLRDNRHFISKANKTDTVNQWLASFEKDVLVLTKAPQGLIDATMVEVTDLDNLPVISRTGNENYAPDQPLPPGVDTDLCIQPVEDLRLVNHYGLDNLEKNFLFAINGYFRPVYRFADWLHISQGVQMMADENLYIASAVDFTEVGGITQIPITPDMVNLINETEVDKFNGEVRATIDLGTDITGKTILMVMGGYLHILDGTYEDIGPKKVLVRINKKRAILREYDKPVQNDKPYQPANVRDNGVIYNTFDAEKYLCQRDSWIVVLNNSDIGLMREPLIGTGIPSEYTFYRAPKGLTFDETGKFCPFVIEGYNKDDCAINTIPTKRVYDLADTISIHQSKVFGNQLRVRQKVEAMDVYTLDLYNF